MKEENNVDLLVKKVTFGLDVEDQATFEKIRRGPGEAEYLSFELAAAAVGLVDLEMDEPMPEHLRARILTSAEEYFSSPKPAAEPVHSLPAPFEIENDFQPTFNIKPRRSWGWLGWAVAAAACIALGVNIWLTRVGTQEPVAINTPPSTPEKITPEQEMAALMASPGDMTKAVWTAGNMKDLKDVGGDVMWSDAKQKGFMRLRGLPANDRSKETYQLWIFDKTQDKSTPIDGGTFDVPSSGEIVIPINAKLRAEGAQMFAITIEKPGGVVVSKREKIAAIAKVETRS